MYICADSHTHKYIYIDTIYLHYIQIYSVHITHTVVCTFIRFQITCVTNGHHSMSVRNEIGKRNGFCMKSL